MAADTIAAPAPLPLLILVVEDDANDAELLHAYLAEAVRDGAQLLHARNLAEGLRLLESHEVHLTLLDLDLPDSSGFQTLERMRAAAAGPVIVISGNGHPSFVQEVLKRRAYDVIPKSELDAATLRRILRLASMHQEAGRALRSTEERFRTTFEHAAVGLAHTDIEGRIMLANGRLCEILGYPREELVGLNFRELSHPEDRDASAAQRASLHRGETRKVSLRKRYLRKGGETIWVQLTVSLVRDAGGNPLYDIAAVEDVSAAVRVEQELQHSERRFRALIDNSAEGIVLMDRDGRILYGSPATSRILGYTDKDTVIGSMGADLVHPDSVGAYLLDLAELRGTPGAVIAARTRLRHKDGSYRLLEGTWTNMLEEPSVGALVANFRDVTQKEQSLRQLAEAEARYRNLAESSPDAILVHAYGEVLYVNPACVKMLHAQAARDIVGRDIHGIVDPRDREMLRGRLARLTTGEHLPFVELRWLRLDGSVADIEASATPIQHAGRAAVQVVARDVTERRQREQALRQAQARSDRLSRMYAALSTANEAILKTDDPQVLYQRVCDLLVEHAGLKLAAVRLLDPASGWIEAAAHAGAPATYLERARVSVNLDLPNAHGPAAKAMIEGCTTVSNDFLAEPTLALWAPAAREAGIAATMSVPLRRDGAPIGLITLYAAEAGWFDPELVGLAERMAENVSFALDNLAHEAGRRRAELAMRESEERFRSLTELASDWFWEQDAEFRFKSFAGGQGDRKWGGDQSLSVGLRRWEIPGLVPLSTSWEEHRALLEARKPFRNFEYLRVGEGGVRRYVTSSGEPVFGADGGFQGYRGTAADITERKSAEHRVRLEHQVARHLADAEDAAGGLTAAMRAICESEGWDCGRYFAVDEAAGLLRVIECWGVADAEVQQFIAASRGMTQRAAAGLAGAVWQSGAPLWLADVSRDPRVSEAGRAINGSMRSAFVFPVTLQARTIGVLSITGREIREPDQALLQTMLAIGSQVGQFLQRKLAEQSMRESEERFRSLTGLSSDWYWEQDAELRFVATGGSQESRGGITAAQHDAMRRWELPGTEPLSGSWDAHKAVLAARQPFRDLVLRRTGNDGEVRYVSVAGEPVFGQDGAFLGYRGIAKDVTESYEAVLAMQESERRLSALFGNLPGMAYRCRNDANWTTQFVSEGARALTGYAPEDFASGRITYGELMHAEDRKGAWDVAQAALRIRAPFVVEYRLRTAEGGEKRVWERGAGVYAPDGTVVALEGFVEDITERRLAEAAVRESEERFRNLSGLSSDWYWEQDAEFRFTHTSVDQGSPVYGDPMRPLGKARWELPLVPQSCTWDQHRETLQAHRTFRDFEYSYAGADGKSRYVSASGYAIFDAAGAFIGYRGIAKDITERKYAEAKLGVHAQRQEAIAQFGQFAIGRRTVEELYTEAARALRCEGVDAVSLLEMYPERGEYLVRATQGEGPHASLGQIGPMAPDSVWPDILRENAPRIAGREYLASRPLDRPWRAWLHGMGSAVYAPVRDNDKPIAMLCIYAVREQAFGPEDVRFAEAIGHVLSAALQRQKAEERLAHLAQFDALTGLPNRTLLQDRLAQSIVQSRRHQVHAGVLFVDLDRFKLINDTLGHHQGDALIRQVGQRLLDCVRAGDTVGRISGDEFAVVLADMAHPDDAALVAQKALDALARPFDLGGNEAYVTASIGIAAFPGDGDSAEMLLKNADMAMYRAKESARNSFCFFTAEMNQRSLAKVALNTDLRRALERAEFTLHYQPKVDLPTGKLRGMEALLRWNHPVRGLVSPAEFIPALEDSGLIIPVGEWVVEEACRQLHAWSAAGCVPVPVAVNLSPKQFRRRDLDAVIGEALVRAGVSAEFLELEITESCLMENPEDAVRVMRNLRAAGLRISIDDFGTGYSSLSYLTRLPLSALKIDRSFVRDADKNADAASIVRAIIDMAQNLHLTVIAEGVETEEEAAFLRRHGCDQAQGYFFGRPVPAGQISERLARA